MTTRTRQSFFAAPKAKAETLGVTIEAEYTVGEYDIQILSAKESDGLRTWLNQEGYKVPAKAEAVLGSYIKQDVKFFVAKVNLEEKSKSGYTFLRPLQVAFESEKFMLPIRLGTANAEGKQELIAYMLTKKGRVETSNYRTVKIPSNMDIPIYTKDVFPKFYKAMFQRAVEKERGKAVFLEYAWNMGWCDPCAADPLPNEDLKALGVWWLDEGAARKGRGQNAFVTRLHVRYDAETFPEDLIFHETSDSSNFQGRYVLRNPFQGEPSCKAGGDYFQSLPARFEKEAQTLANLTGWEITEIRAQMEENGQSFDADKMIPNVGPWWQRMWGK